MFKLQDVSEALNKLFLFEKTETRENSSGKVKVKVKVYELLPNTWRFPAGKKSSPSSTKSYSALS